MQTNRNAIKIILNLMHSNLIVNVTNLILLQLGDLDDINRVPPELGLLQLPLEYLQHTAIVRVVVDPAALTHVPGDYVQVEELVRIYVVPHIIKGV